MKKALSLILIALSLSCTGELKKEIENQKSLITKLETENKELKEELANFKMDPAILLSRAEKAYEEKNIEGIKDVLKEFESYHPSSELKNKASSILLVLNKEIEKEKAEKEKLKKAEEKKRLAAVNKLRKTQDEVSGITWYKNPYFTHYTNTNLTSLYIGKKGSSIWLRMNMSYKGEDWIFFENAYLSYEGNTKEILFDKYQDKETEVGNGGVWEWIDVSISDSDILFLNKLAQSSDSKMRLSGKYSRTRNLSTNEKKAISDVLLAYDVLKNNGK